MPYKDPEKKKEYMKDYYKNNKEQSIKYREKNKNKKKEYMKEYMKTHKEYKKEYMKEYLKTHKEEKKEYMKKYKKTPAGIKSRIISHWKNYGLIDSNNDKYEKLYNLYLNTNECNICKYEFDNSNRRCLDHCHSTGLFRQILCHRCNSMDNWIKVKAVMIIQKSFRKYIRNIK